MKIKGEYTFSAGISPKRIEEIASKTAPDYDTWELLNKGGDSSNNDDMDFIIIFALSYFTSMCLILGVIAYIETIAK